MTIERFLFEEDVEQLQAEILINEFPNLQFKTAGEFFDFFEKQNIKLAKRKNIRVDDRGVLTPTNELLQRFKEFKSSTDYDYVKKYIAEEKRIQKAIRENNIIDGRTVLDTIKSNPVDPFFNFVVRKILTGSENGVLPSESLQVILDDIARRSKSDIDIEPDVSRDDTGRVISFDNYLRNKGSVKANLLDERFNLQTFTYVVPRQFTQLEDASKAEVNIIKNADQFSVLFPEDGDGATLVENLKKLILDDSNSPISLQAKIERLQDQILLLEELAEEKDTDISILQKNIVELTRKAIIVDTESEVKEETITALNEIISSTLSDLQNNVSDQLTNTADAFDALATQLEAQAQKAEENAAKQLAAFEKAVGGIAESLKPKEPEPDPENPAGDVIKQINQLLDKIDVISDKKYTPFKSIFTKLGASEPSKYSYLYVPPSKGNAYKPSEEIKQALKWNNEIKPQLKSLITGITDIDVAKEIKKNVEDISRDEFNVNNAGLKAIVKDAILAWATDFNAVRGDVTPTVRKVVLELGEVWEGPSDEKEIKEKAATLNQGLFVAGAAKIRSSPDVFDYNTPVRKLNKKITDASKDQLVNVMNIFTEVTKEGF